MKTEEFVARCYTKSRLAMMYFPELSRDSAVKKLRRWINNCTPLSDELTQLGHNPMLNSYTAREVRIIVRHLGEP